VILGLQKCAIFVAVVFLKRTKKWLADSICGFQFSVISNETLQYLWLLIWRCRIFCFTGFQLSQWRVFFFFCF